jgi:hypothetical protein
LRHEFDFNASWFTVVLSYSKSCEHDPKAYLHNDDVLT